MEFDYKESTIVRHVAGSQAYGTSTPESDLDIRGIFAAPESYIRTPFYAVKEVDVADEEDTKLFELTNFMKLYMDMNPNIVETLWVDKGDLLEKTVAYDHMRSYNQALLSKKAAFTFSGYAIAQLKRIKGHNKWLNKPQPVDPPKQTDFVTLVHNFTGSKILKVTMADIRDDHRLIHYGADIYGVYEAKGYQTYDQLFTLNTNSDDTTGFYTKEPTVLESEAGIILGDADFGKRRLPKFLIKFNKQQYKDQKEIHRNYWSWVANRNVKRSALEQEHGYDTKHAGHLVRLLRMAEEILTDGEVVVKRPDAAELLEIRNGSWNYDELLAYAESKDKAIQGNLYKNSQLRTKPDIKLASKVLMETQDLMWDQMKNTKES